ncbi:MAG: lysophospholipid acyltransferase family protein [Candidatus Dadabacteria bacterium]
MYYVVYGLLYLFSLLPLKLLYVVADFFYVVLYHIIGYRKKVVFSNLTLAFPNKTEEEKKIIAKKFYRNFIDTFIETIKQLSAGEDYASRHFKGDYTLFRQLNEAGKKCQVHLGHNFNWEFANLAVAANIPQKLLTVYMPVENKIIDKIFYKIRSKTGAILLPATDIRRAILHWRNERYALALVADQNPGNPDNAYWVNFFGRPAPFLKAPENGARIANLPVIFSYFTKAKRGQYDAYFIMGEENPSALPKGELTRNYVRFLEGVISEHPEMWLWSHRRWKFEWKPEYGPVIG